MTMLEGRCRYLDSLVLRICGALRRSIVWVLILTTTAALATEPPKRDLASLSARKSPEWLNRGVIYQIWLRSFTPEGTLRAAAKRLPDVADLGATIVYLSPVQLMDDDMRREFWSTRMKESASNNPKNPYRIKDYERLDPEFGTPADLKDFVATAHRLGLHVLMDLVYLHTGPTCVLMKHPEYYRRNDKGQILMTGLWPFPRLDFQNRQLREYLWANMAHWVKDFGADGFRCDCAGAIPLDFWEEARDRLDAVRPDVVLLAEGRSPANQLKAFDVNYSRWAFTCQAVVTRGAPASALQEWWKDTRERFPRGARFIYYNVNHDLPRVDVALGERGAQAVSVLNFTLDGVPFLYNGQEIGDATPMDLLADWSIPWDAADVPTGGLLKRLFYQRLCRLRQSEPALVAAGEVAWLSNDRPDSVLSYLRRAGQDDILVVVNLSNRALGTRVVFPDKSVASYRGLFADLELTPTTGRSTDWIERGMQAVICNPEDLAAKRESVSRTPEGLAIPLAGFDYFVGKKKKGDAALLGRSQSGLLPKDDRLQTSPKELRPLFSLLIAPPESETQTSVTLFWDPPSDDDRGLSYEVYCDGKPAGTTAKTFYTVMGLAPGMTYSFSVRARDAKGNLSATTNELSHGTKPKGRVFNVVDYGAVGDGTTKSTRAIQQAIDACTPGGTVHVPAGTFVSGALFLKSNMTLSLAKNARLKGSADIDDYRPFLLNRYSGWEMETFASLINAGTLAHDGSYRVTNLAIRGEGTISGGGSALGKAMLDAEGYYSRARLICLMNCKDVAIAGLTLEESPSWTVHYIYCRNVTCHGLTIVSEGIRNGDGIDPDSSVNSYIFDCDVSTSDDCIAIKSGKNPEGNRIGKPTQNVFIAHCRFKGHGMSIGSEMSGGVRNVTVRDCVIAKDDLNGLQIKVPKERGGYVRDIRVVNCTLSQIRIVTKISYNTGYEAAPKTPFIGDMEFAGLDMKNAVTRRPAIVIDGFEDAKENTRNIRFQDIRMSDASTIAVTDCTGITFREVLTERGEKPVYRVKSAESITY